MDPDRFAEELFYNGRERLFGRRRQGGEGELSRVEGTVKRADVVGLRERHFLPRQLVQPKGRDRLGLLDARGREAGVGPRGGSVAVKGRPVALYFIVVSGVVAEESKWGLPF